MNEIDTGWFVGVGILLAITILFLWISTTVFSHKNFAKDFDIEGDKGAGCGCFFAFGLFFLCYLWTFVIVSNVEYGRPYINGKPSNSKNK